MLARQAEALVASAGGGRLRTRIDGPAKAPWLVFSNSLATDLHLWDAQVLQLSGSWQILRYDYRGHGGSDPHTQGSIGPEMLAVDLLAVMDEAGVEQACHVGVSIGALAGLEAAASRPGRLHKLVVCNAQLTATPESAASLERRARRALGSGMHGLVEPTLEKWFGQSPLPLPASVRERIAAMIRTTDAVSFAAYARGMQTYDLAAVVAGLQAPVLLIAGTADGGIPAAFTALAARHPQVACELIEGAGHLPCIQAADAFNVALRWLER